MYDQISEPIVGRTAQIICKDRKERTYTAKIESITKYGHIISYTRQGVQYHSFIPIDIILETRLKQRKGEELKESLEESIPFDFAQIPENENVYFALLDRLETVRKGQFEGFTKHGIRVRYTEYGSTYHSLIPYGSLREMYYKVPRDKKEDE